MSASNFNSKGRRWIAAVACLIFGLLLTSTFFQTCLSSRHLASNFISPVTWLALSGLPQSPSDDASFRFLSVALPLGMIGLATWILGAGLLVWRTRVSWSEALADWGRMGWIWWILLDGWEWVWIASNAIGWSHLALLLSYTPQFWFAACFAGWIATWAVIANRKSAQTLNENHRLTRWLVVAGFLHILIFTAMNWRLYFNLLVPHGDSVMYEEHLWNLLHGKGFRSYLDQGLFLGEHIQFVHLFLLPLYIIWPSHLLLEACSTTALACGAFPVYWMTVRHTGQPRTALAVSVAYLLYFPMQFLDIEIDLKTFRPESFGIPLLLLTLDQIDRRNLIGSLIGLMFCLSVKEDYSLIFGPVGVWIALSEFWGSRSIEPVDLRRTWLSDRKLRFVVGTSLSVFSVVYLWLATRVIMPWFRSGVEVHYASYFAKFGKSPEEIVRTMLGRPDLVVESLLNAETALYAIALLAPLAFLPLLSPGRLAVGLPLFGILCLNELEGSRTPQHQFHAPLVAILFWALAAGMPNAHRLIQVAISRMWPKEMSTQSNVPVFLRHLVWSSSLATGFFFSLGPLGIPFWDPGSGWNWANLYSPTHRAEMFARIAEVIPVTARVASTDFVHPRYTHFERSYDYSNYQRKVSGEGRRIPADTQYIVIDTQHRYSTIKSPEQIPEFRDEPEIWELLPDQSESYFLILKRKGFEAAEKLQQPTGSQSANQ